MHMKKDAGSFKGDKETKHAHASDGEQRGLRQGSPAWYALYGVRLDFLSGQGADTQKLGKPPTAQDIFNKVDPSRLRIGHLSGYFEPPTASGLLKALKQIQEPLNVLDHFPPPQ